MNKIYFAAKKFLVREIGFPDAEKIVESYLELPDKSNEPIRIEQLFASMLASAQNTNMKANVIGGSIGGINNLGKVLFEFNPSKVEKSFANNHGELLTHIEKILKPSGQIRKTQLSIWPKYCKTILSAASFLNQFKDGDDFYIWANHFYKEPKSMAALPMILAAEVEGIGYPLACDFLKELGFVDYGKPDVHIIDIFVGVGLCNKGSSPYQIQKIISQIASAAQVSSYNVDKLFWLIGSGKFYKHPDLGNNGHIGRKKEQFITETLK